MLVSGVHVDNLKVLSQYTSVVVMQPQNEGISFYISGALTQFSELRLVFEFGNEY